MKMSRVEQLKLKEAEIKTQICELQAELIKVQNDRELVVLRDRIEKFESKKWHYDPEMTFHHLDRYSADQLEYLTYKIHGPHGYYYSPKYQVTLTIFAKGFPSGDVTWVTVDDDGYKEQLMMYLKDRSCEYCKQISHMIDECPKIAQKSMSKNFHKSVSKL